MNPTTKKMFTFILCIIGLSIVFALFTGKYILSVIIGLFVSVSLVYSPKKTNATIAKQDSEKGII